MSSALRDLLHLVKLPSDRRRAVFADMLELARDDGAEQLVAHIQRALMHEDKVAEIEDRWRARERASEPAPEMLEVDNLMDHTVSAIRYVLVAHLRSALPDYNKSAAAERISSAIFPNGVDEVISLPYVEELSAVENIADKLRGELSQDVQTLGLHHLVARLAKLLVPYREAVARGPDKISYHEVKNARDRGHDFMLETVALIVGRYFRTDDQTHDKKRAQLLYPLLHQQGALRDDMRSRHGAGTESGPENED